MAVKYRKGMKAKIKRNIVNLKKEFPPDEYPCVLDVGSKEGYAVYWLRKYGYSALGMEIEKKYCSPVILHGDFLEWRFKKSIYDIVFSRHSLEHIALENMYGTCAFLEKSYKILRIGGILYIIVPVLQWAEFEFDNKLNLQDSFNELKKLLLSWGFEIIKQRDRENALLIGRKV